MAKYKFYIADEFTKIPLIGGEIIALTKFLAKRKIYKEILNKDKGYIITLRKLQRRWGCKYWNEKVFDSLIERYIGECHCSQWENDYFWYETCENDFCSRGERKEVD